MSKNILYVINHMDWFWSHRLPLALAAKERGYHVFVAAFGAASDQRLATYGFTGVELPQGVTKIIPAIRTHLKTHHIDLMHAVTIKSAFMAGLAARGTNVKIIHTIAGLGYLFHGDGQKAKVIRTLIGPLLKLALRSKHTTLIFQNPDDRALMIKRGFATEASSVLIRGSGVDTHAFTQTPEPETNTPLVVFPTRLVWEKGLKPFVEMANILQQKGTRARFAIAGGINTTNPNAVTNAQMNDLIANSTVEWLGHVSDMPALLASSNLVVYPSWYGEGVPKVLLEAAAVGRAIITTDHPGCREVVEPGVNGLLVPVRDATALAHAAETLLNDSDLRRKMGQASREKAEAEFDVNRVVAETVKLY